MSLIKPVKSCSEALTPATCRRKLMLQMTNLTGNNNKFYYLELHELPHTGVLKTRYGRTGMSETVEYRLAAFAMCQREVEWLRKNKEGKGYREVETVDTAAPEVSQEKVPAGAPKPSGDSGIPGNIVELISFMFGTTTSYIATSVKTPLGKLTRRQISAGKEILDKIKTVVDSGGLPPQAMEDDPGFLALHNEFYSAIPQNLGRSVNIRTLLLKDPTALAKQEDLLQALEDMLGVQDAAIGNDVLERYRSLGARFDLMPAEEYRRIERWFHDSRSRHHRADAEVLDIIRVDRSESLEERTSKILTVEAFHGTKSPNLLGICSRGLLLPGQHSGSITGAMFGRGVYGAIHSTKSMQYCGGGWRDNSPVQYMFIIEMGMGKYLECKSTSDYNRLAHGGGCPQGHDSTWAKAGSSLLHDELIVYGTQQVRLKYLIKFKLTHGW